MKEEAEGSVNERLDHLGIGARVCQESELVEWPGARKQAQAKPWRLLEWYGGSPCH